MEKTQIIQALRDFKAQNAKKYGIHQLGLFGSIARGEVHENSDIDICIVISEPDPFRIVHIKEELEETFENKVDIVRLREKMNPHLRKRIEKDCIYV